MTAPSEQRAGIVDITPIDGPEERAAGGWSDVLRDGLSRLRRERRWTQQDLAAACGLHRETIGRLERQGGRPGEPAHQTLRALALAFNHEDLAAFWSALCAAATEGAPGMWVRLDLRQHELLTRLAHCTAEQQELVHILVAFFRAQIHPRPHGREPLSDVEALLALLKQRPRRS